MESVPEGLADTGGGGGGTVHQARVQLEDQFPHCFINCNFTKTKRKLDIKNLISSWVNKTSSTGYKLNRKWKNYFYVPFYFPLKCWKHLDWDNSPFPGWACFRDLSRVVMAFSTEAISASLGL